MPRFLSQASETGRPDRRGVAAHEGLGLPELDSRAALVQRLRHHFDPLFFARFTNAITTVPKSVVYIALLDGLC